MKSRILWVEDSARLELRKLVGPIYVSGKYDFHLADDVTKAVRFVQAGRFDALIVDIRLPPGAAREWTDVYRHQNADGVRAHLGLRFLAWLLGHDRSVLDSAPPDWATPKRVGVFTVEGQNEIGKHLIALGIEVFAQKVPGLPDTILVELIERLLTQSIPAT